MEKKNLKMETIGDSDRLKGLLHFVIQNCPRCSVPADETICPYMKAPCLFNPQNLEKWDLEEEQEAIEVVVEVLLVVVIIAYLVAVLDCSHEVL